MRHGRSYARGASFRSRGWVSTWLGCATLVVVALVGTTGARASSPELRSRAEDARAKLHQRLQDRLEGGRFHRSDGYVYAIDIAQLMTYAAMRGDRGAYEALRERALATLVSANVEGGAHRFVAWRYASENPERSPDASGTTEALEVARALWQGAATLSTYTKEDRGTALAILDGYLTHQRVSAGVWLVRNYYNFGTGAFADDSYLVDYAPDFVAQVAASTGRADLCELASRSAQLLRDARTEAGLYHAMVSPGLQTLMPFAIHSPNGLEALSNVAAVAEKSVGSNRSQARAILRFAHARLPDLRLYYDARTGEARRQAHAGVVTLASLTRLSVLLGEASARDALLGKLLQKLPELEDPSGTELYALGQVLLALEFALRHLRGQSPPLSFRTTPCEV